MKFDDDALDRALAALPLEEPPANMRAAILAATAYRPAPIFTPAEGVAIACIVAALAWLAALLAPQIGSALAGALSNVTLLAWAGTGVAIAAGLELFTESQPAYAALRRAKGRVGP